MSSEPNEPARLTRLTALPLAVGSIAGSGILFLPSAVYHRAGAAAIPVWGIALLVCVPMVVMFNDVVRRSVGDDAVEACVRDGLGERAARGVPMLFAGLVAIGLPAGAMVAGRFVTDGLGLPPALAALPAVIVLGVAIGAALLGSTASRLTQRIAVIALVGLTLALAATAIGSWSSAFDHLDPRRADVGAVPSAVLLAFWAFVGFENLTFLRSRFRRPDRDFLAVSTTALGIYAVLVLGLTAAIAARLAAPDVDEETGLLQLAGALPARTVLVAVVTVIGVAAMTVNAIAWVHGMSAMTDSAARRGLLPSILASRADAPGRPTIALAVAFGIATVVFVVRPDLVVPALGAASASFVVIYALTIVAYTRRNRRRPTALVNAALLPVFVLGLAGQPAAALYPVAVVVVGSLLKSRATPSRLPADSEPASASWAACTSERWAAMPM
jgi:amino acid efflux transporter